MTWLDLLSIVVALGAATMGGTFFAFSNFVMPALGRLPGAAGMAAMRSIDVTVMNPLFLGVFMLTALLGVVHAIGVFVAGGSLWAAAGGLLYVVGTFLVTSAINVPMNVRLRTADEAYWQVYLRDWTRWNTVRTIAGLLAVLCLMLALLS